MIGFTRVLVLSFVSSTALIACTPDSIDESGLALLGSDSHSIENVSFKQVVGSADLNRPTDLAFSVYTPNELWIVNQDEDSMTVVTDMGAESLEINTYTDPTAAHFLAKPSGIAFGTGEMFATAQQTDEVTPFTGNAPADFMGPTMWKVGMEEFNAGHESHYDMLHNSPNGSGIAWEVDNVYWIFDGSHESLTRYDFASDHGAGGSDHSDADVKRFVSGEVAFVPGTVSHMEFHHESHLLYIADTGNQRIAVLDPSTGEIGARITPNYDGCPQKMVNDADIWTLIGSDTGEDAVDLQQPTGLAIHDDILYVVDSATSIIWAFTLDGDVIDWLETGADANSLMGIDFDPNGALYVTDVAANAVFKLLPLSDK